MDNSLFEYLAFHNVARMQILNVQSTLNAMKNTNNQGMWRSIQCMTYNFDVLEFRLVWLELT